MAEEEHTQVDKDYVLAFNIGYRLARETGLNLDNLKSINNDPLKKIGIENSKFDVIKLGVKQYEKDIEVVNEVFKRRAETFIDEFEKKPKKKEH